MAYSKSRFERDLLTGCILLLALFGGVQFYLYPAILRIGIILGFGLLAWAGWLILRSAKIPFAPSLFWLAAAVGLSVGANWSIYQATLSRVWLYAVAVAVLVISHHYLNEKQIYAGIYRAGWVWPWTWLLAGVFGWAGNANVVAFWSVLFIAVGLSGNRWFYLLPQLLILFWLGSRGAIVAAGVVLLVYLWPSLRRARYVTALSVPITLAGLIALIAYRPHTAGYRLYYWGAAWAAFRENWLFGVGPGGLKFREMISEPFTTQFQAHAHNSLITWIAETGVIGLAALAMAIFSLLHTSYSLQRWQLAALAGIAAHSLVDEPLWWPGPLLVAALVISVTPSPKNG